MMDREDLRTVQVSAQSVTDFAQSDDFASEYEQFCRDLDSIHEAEAAYCLLDSGVLCHGCGECDEEFQKTVYRTVELERVFVRIRGTNVNKVNAVISKKEKDVVEKAILKFMNVLPIFKSISRKHLRVMAEER